MVTLSFSSNRTIHKRRIAMGKLRDRMKEDLIFRAYSPHMQDGYLRWVQQFAKYHMRSREEMGEQEIREFLFHLAKRKVSPFTQDQYVNAIKFLYSVPCLLFQQSDVRSQACSGSRCVRSIHSAVKNFLHPCALPLLVAVSIAASGCRFWLPFGAPELAPL